MFVLSTNIVLFTDETRSPLKSILVSDNVKLGDTKAFPRDRR